MFHLDTDQQMPVDPGHHQEPSDSPRLPPFLSSVLDHAEVGIVVVDQSRRAVYMNLSARALLEAPEGNLPDWTLPHLSSIWELLGRVDQQIARWEHEELVLRIRARPLAQHDGLVVLELRVAQASTGRHIADQLARGLGLTISDGKLLALLWRGLSNDEIAQIMGVRVGTIKSRLFRLYQRLGVKRRPAAVLRAAEVIAA